MSKVKSRKKGKVKKWIVTALVVMVVAAVGVFFFLNRGKGPEMNMQYKTEKVEKRTIVSSLTGSGALQPADFYTVTTLIQGEVLSADFEEGDIVEKDSILYQIDSSDVSNSIEKTQISLEQAERNYNDAVDRKYIKATIAGKIFSLDVKVGDQVTQGQTIAVIRDSDTMELTVPFPSDDAKNMSPGQSATVILDTSFETLSGTIQSISANDIVGDGNMITRNVKISVKNPGGLGINQAATVSVGGINCAAPGKFEYKAESMVVAKNTGTVASLQVKEGQTVSKDQIILTLGGKDIENSVLNAQDNLKNAQLSVDSTRNQLDNYTIKSPIKGTIVDKQLKEGDTIEAGLALCTIYDLSYLEMNMSIDELDISKVSVGQSVQITADAVEGKKYTGTITKVSVVSESTISGATAYPVTVRIDESEGLRPGMNVDAEIVLARVENVISVPNEAVNRGNVVLVTADSPSAANKIDREAPEGFVYVQVETGVSDDNYIEIVSGLTEHDTVAYVYVERNSGMFPMGGGMQSGGMTGGGMQGGNGMVGNGNTGGMSNGGGTMPGGGMSGGSGGRVSSGGMSGGSGRTGGPSR